MFTIRLSTQSPSADGIHRNDRLDCDGLAYSRAGLQSFFAEFLQRVSLPSLFSVFLLSLFRVSLDFRQCAADRVAHLIS